MRVEVRYYATVMERVGLRSEPVELPGGATVGALLELLVERYPRLGEHVIDERGDLMEYLSYAVNSVDILSLKGFETALKDGDVVLLMPPIGGG